MRDTPIPALLAALAAGDRAIARPACDEAIARVGTDPELLRAVTDLLSAPEPAARFAAAFVLFRTRRPTLRLLPALLCALDLPDGDCRWEAAHMLVALGRIEHQVFPALLHEAAHGEGPARRRMALYAVRELGPEHEEAEVCFLRALGDDDPGVRRAGFASLAKLRSPSERVLSHVFTALREDPDPRIRMLATVVVTSLLEHFPQAVPRVQEQLFALAATSHETPADTAERRAEAALARAARLALTRLRELRGDLPSQPRASADEPR